MTDYTREVFEEIAPPENDCCRVAYLSAVIHTAAVLELERGERRLVFTRRGLKAKLDAPLSAMFGMTADGTAYAGRCCRCWPSWAFWKRRTADWSRSRKASTDISSWPIAAARRMWPART